MPDTVAMDGFQITVEESTDELRYVIQQLEPGPRPPFPIWLVLLFIVLPLSLASAIAYAITEIGTDRQEWELVLSGLFVLQLLTWPVLASGGFLSWAVRQWRTHGKPRELVFTRECLVHGVLGETGDRVCELAEVRGVKVFVYQPERDSPDDEENEPGEASERVPAETSPLPKEAALSLLIGPDRLTYGMFGGDSPEGLTVLAHDIHRRLSVFRRNQGLAEPLDAVGVEEQTEAESEDLTHAMLHTEQLFGGFLTYRGSATLWCVVGFAGMLGSFQMLVDAGVPRVLVVCADMVVGFYHIAAIGMPVWFKPDEPLSGEAT